MFFYYDRAMRPQPPFFGSVCQSAREKDGTHVVKDELTAD